MPDDQTPPGSGKTGRCNCGAVSYEVRGPSLDVSLCHCHRCQQFTGSAFFARALFPRENVTINGATKAYDFSEHFTRHFCPGCGSPLFAERRSGGKFISVSLGTLDDPSALAPQRHMWVESKVDWLKLDDDLPKHPQAPPT